MRVLNRLLLLLLLPCSIPLTSSADVLLFMNGQALTGTFQGADQTTVTFQVDGQMRRYRISDINSVTFTNPNAISPPPQGSDTDRSTSRGRNSSPEPLSPSSAADSAGGYGAPSDRSNPSDDRPKLRRRAGSSDSPTAGTYPGPDSSGPDRPPVLRRSDGPYNPPAESTSASAPNLAGISVHAGSVVTVRMIDPVDSSVNSIGEIFRASLDEPLVVDGRTVAERGADVTAKLVSKSEAGRVTGRSELNLVLMNITIQGRRYDISTSEVSQAGSSRGKQSAERIGVGTVLGAAIGAIAGGGKGAAIGAATGAGAGTAVQVMTHGENVKIPAETRLDFTLAQPLNL